MRVLGSLPAAWVPALGRGLGLLRLLRWRVRATGLENLALAFGVRRTRDALRLVFDATGLHVAARLRTLHPRDSTLGKLRAAFRAASWWTEQPTPLLLTTRLGASALAEAAVEVEQMPRADLDALPARAADAAWLPWLGRMTAVDLLPLREALARGRGVRLLLVLPDGVGWTPWWSPDLTHPREDPPLAAGPVAERALRALEVLVRAAPHLWDWTWPRWAIRPEREVEGHAPSSRLAPWLNPRRRTGRRARRGR